MIRGRFDVVPWWSTPEMSVYVPEEFEQQPIKEKDQMRDIAHVHVLNSNAHVPANVVKDTCHDYSDRFPDEDCFLSDLDDTLSYDDDEDRVCANAECNTTNDCDAKFCKECGSKFPSLATKQVAITRLEWYGHNSARSFHSIFVKQIVPHVKGSLEALVFLEGDDVSPSKMFGFTIEDGVYTKCEVDVRLVAIRE